MTSPRTLFLVPSAVLTVVAARAMSTSPALAVGGPSRFAVPWLVAVAALLGLVGWKAMSRRGQESFGVLLLLLGAAWSCLELSNPGGTSGLFFTIGLFGGALMPVVAVHVALACPSGVLERARERWLVWVGYLVALGLAGLLPTVAFDPQAQLCAACPDNYLAVTSSPHFAQLATRVAFLVEAAYLAFAVLLLLHRLRGTSPAGRRVTAAGLVAATGVAVAAAVDEIHGFTRGYTSNDRTDSSAWWVQGGWLVVLAAGTLAAWWRSRRARTMIASLVLELDATAMSGGLRQVLRLVLDDPGLELAYPVGVDSFVDAEGSPLGVERLREAQPLPLREGGEVVALLLTRVDLAADPGLLQEVEAAARLGLQPERLRADVEARVKELRLARREAVRAADAERRRLERDLHDGAQQRLVVLALALQMLSPTAPAARRCLDAAQSELRMALAELRQLAHGIFPAVLTDEGLVSALEALGDTRDIRLEGSDLSRLPPDVEAAAYFLVSALAQQAPVSVFLRVGAERLQISVLLEGALPSLHGLGDRVDALDGVLSVRTEGHGACKVEVELPCAS